MKFKVGDKVKVRQDLENGYFDINNLEDYQNDKIFTIKSGREHNFYGYVYELLEDNKINYDFKEDMLIPANEEIILKGVKNEQGIYKMEIPKNLVLVGSHTELGYIRIMEFKEKEEILDEKEKEYLRAVINPFRNKVKYIKKYTCHEKEYIDIGVKSDTILLPCFKKNTMYKGMEKYKEYTLEELGL